ncbi:2',5' RNA ligase family [Oxobacter pfennigii]|uniref:RNA 2',3'-cyclic phosphodiesterase n=1 Tax=Oxobacter pfennigii TaxID=36849 RepID=A0A0P8W844_9CLOT|nr:RNA 2',3'-cyclic phosphodiesterase [Oxobacter pfennigii]KPU44190.1 2',5' RNA ligase family [Oxobacter pfennigii]
MRVFIGIDFPEDIKKEIIEIQKFIKDSSISGRWKYIDNFHLTLKFVGETTQDKIAIIHKKVEEELKEYKSFNIKTGALSCFKGKDSLRVVYLSLEDNDDELKGLAEIIDGCCSSAGIEKEKRIFTPHITIAQDVVLKAGFPSLKAQLENRGSLSIDVDGVYTFKSEQIGNKRVYTKINCIKLK